MITDDLFSFRAVWDPEIAHLRQVYTKMIVAATILMILMMWFTLPVYWGSLGETSDHVPNLKGGAEVGGFFTQWSRA